MSPKQQKPIFGNRYDAGEQLAAKLNDYKAKSPVVLAIPNGGVAIGVRIAIALEAEFDLIISRKIPLPLSPEGGFGAMTDDGTIILNDEMVRRNCLTPEQIESQVGQVRASIRQRSLLHHRDRPPVSISGKTAIIVDDGLASGFTMMAAVASVRRRRPGEVVVAVPVASAAGLQQLQKVADKVIAGAVSTTPRFYLADFYQYWHDPGDDEVSRYLEEYRAERFRSNFERRFSR